MTQPTNSDIVAAGASAANDMVLGLFAIALSTESSPEERDKAVKPRALFTAIRDVLIRAAVDDAPTSQDLALARAVLAIGENGDAS